MRFDKVIKKIVSGIKKGIDLFMDVINGKISIKDIVNRLITALKGLPNKVMFEYLTVFYHCPFP